MSALPMSHALMTPLRVCERGALEDRATDRPVCMAATPAGCPDDLKISPRALGNPLISATLNSLSDACSKRATRGPPAAKNGPAVGYRGEFALFRNSRSGASPQRHGATTSRCRRRMGDALASRRASVNAALFEAVLRGLRFGTRGSSAEIPRDLRRLRAICQGKTRPTAVAHSAHFWQCPRRFKPNA